MEDDLLSLKGSLESALSETQKEMAELCSDDDAEGPHLSELRGRQEQIRGLLQHLSAMNERGDEMELREELSAEDEQLLSERMSGRRIAHSAGPSGDKPSPEQTAKPSVVKDRIVERTVDPSRIIEKDKEVAAKVMMAAVDTKRPASRDDVVVRSRDQLDQGIYPHENDR